MTPAGPLVATVRRRALITHRVDAALAAARLPSGIEPITVDGHALVSLCYSDVRGLRLVGTPFALGVSFQYLVTRMLTRVSPLGAPAFVAAHVLDALADSWLVRAGSRLVYRLPLRPARIELHDDDGSWRLRAATKDGPVADCTLVATPEHEAFAGSVFTGRDEALSTVLSMLHGTHVGPRTDRAHVLSQTFDPGPIRAGRASGHTLSASARALGEAAIDHVLLGYDVPYRYSACARRIRLEEAGPDDRALRARS